MNVSDSADSCLGGHVIPCFGPPIVATIDLLDFSWATLATGSATVGTAFLGSSALGGAVTELINDRWVVWLGAKSTLGSVTINTYDRLLRTLTTVGLDPDDLAWPSGRLVDLGNGTALGVAAVGPPRNRHAPGGYALNAAPGLYVLDLATRSTSAFKASPSGWPILPELATLARPGGGRDRFYLSRSDLPDGTITTAFRYDSSAANVDLGIEVVGAFGYSPAGLLLPVGHGSTLYFPGIDGADGMVTANAFWQRDYFNGALYCVNAYAARPSTEFWKSLPFGPGIATLALAHRPVYGPALLSTDDTLYMATSKVADADEGRVFALDRGVSAADRCRQPPVLTEVIRGLADVPSTRFLEVAGRLVYGTANGKLMALDVSTTPATVRQVADLVSGPSSSVRGYLTETSAGVVSGILFDVDANGRAAARRLFSVDVSTGSATFRDVSRLVGEDERYPGVLGTR